MSAEMAEKQTENNVAVIAGLIKSCRAAQAGFLNAAEHVRNSDLSAYFTGRSMERARFAAELERAAHQLAESELSRTSAMADRVRRAWAELQFTRGHNDGAILSVVAAAERTTRELLSAGAEPGFSRRCEGLVGTAGGQHLGCLRPGLHAARHARQGGIKLLPGRHFGQVAISGRSKRVHSPACAPRATAP